MRMRAHCTEWWNLNKSREVIEQMELVGKQNVQIVQLTRWVFLLFTNFLHTVYTNTQNMKHISNLVSIFFCWLILSFIRACLDDIKTHKTIYTAHTFSYDCLLCSVHCFAHCSFGLLFSFMFFFLLNIDNLFVLFVHVGVLCVCSKVKEPHDFSICFFTQKRLSVCMCVCDIDLFEWTSEWFAGKKALHIDVAVRLSIRKSGEEIRNTHALIFLCKLVKEKWPHRWTYDDYCDKKRCRKSFFPHENASNTNTNEYERTHCVEYRGTDPILADCDSFWLLLTFLAIYNVSWLRSIDTD